MSATGLSATGLSATGLRPTGSAPPWSIGLSSAVVLVAAMGCASAPPLAERTPTDHGEPGPIYAVTTDDGHLARVKVFTDGADHYDQQVMDRVAIHVGFWLSNESFEPLRLEPGFITVASSLPRNGFRVDLAPTPDDVDDLVVLPGQRRQIDTYAYVPVHVLPDDIDAFQVRWAVRAERSGRAIYAQRTPFLAAHDEPRQGRRFAPAVDLVFYRDGELPEVTSLEIP